MKRVFYVGIICIVGTGCWSSNKKEIIITGFMRKTDKLVVRYSNSVISDWNPDCNRNTSKICFIYETLKCPSSFPLFLQIDSAGSILFDTIFLIPKENKEPVLSIENPLENGGKRRAFTIDNSKFEKY